MKARYKTGNATGAPDQKGAAAVEFAIVISLLVLILGGIIEFGRVLWYYDALSKATRDGARYLSTAATATDNTFSLADMTKASDIVEDAATQAGLPGFDGSVSHVTIGCEPVTSPSCKAPDYVKVEITGYSVAFGSWFAIPLPSGPWALTPHTTMRYMCDAGATTSC